MTVPDALELGLRGWAVPEYRLIQEEKRREAAQGRESKPYVDPGPSEWDLVFDTETTRDPGQGLRIGGYQVRRNGRIRQASIFYEPTAVSARELDTIHRYAAEHGLRMLDRDEFVEKVFFRFAYYRRGLIIGHNLPFDIAKLAIDHASVRSRDRSMRGGFSFKLADNERRPHIQVKRTHPGAAFIKLTIPSGRHAEARNREQGGAVGNHHGYFLDTVALGGALLGGKPSLKRLAEILDTEHKKGDADHGEEITPRYLDYLLLDVQVTTDCADELRKRYTAYGLAKPPWHIYSEASIGKAYLDAMAIRPWDPGDFPDPIMATVLETYYGGRTECAIRKVPVPGVYLDFRSQYPTAFVLQNLHCYLTCERVAWAFEAPGPAQRLLDEATVETVLDPALWPQLDALVLIEPDGDRLPTRARFTRFDRDLTKDKRNFNVAVSFRRGGDAQWWTLADAIASKLHTGKAPKVLSVLRFEPLGHQSGLAPIDLAGDPRYRIDPNREDFIKRLVELRAVVKTEMKQARRSGDAGRAEELEAIQLAIKITANAVAYGIGIEMNVIEHREKAKITVHLPDESSYRTRVGRTENPGSRFHPLVATLVTASGRLMLATAIALIDRAGGVYATCDTDSVFVVATRDGGLIPCPGGPHRLPEGRDAVLALSHADVDRRLVAPLVSLNPYDDELVPGSILELEEENLDPETGDQREIECFAIAAKCYSLFVRDENGRPQIIGGADKRKRSEHGLGHLLPPNAVDPRVDERAWLDRWWEHLLCTELGVEDDPPEWFDAPAVGRLTVTTPREERTFTDLNDGRKYAEAVTPWNFLCIAHPKETERGREGGPKLLVAPFERDPDERLRMDWIDRSNPAAGPRRIHTDGSHVVDKGTVAVQSFANYFKDYRQRPERKMLGPDGRPCHTWTKGLLGPRLVTPKKVLRIGKESNRLSETPLPPDIDEQAMVEYPEPRRCPECGQKVSGRRKWCRDACRKRAERYLRQQRQPSSGT